MICDRVIIVKREETIADIFSIYILVEASRRFEWFSVPRVKQQLTQRSAVMILIIDEAWKLAGPFQPSVKEKREEGTNASREKRKDVEYCHDFLPWFIDSKTSFFSFQGKEFRDGALETPEISRSRNPKLSTLRIEC